MNQDQRELLELAAHAMQQTGDRNFANYDVVEHAVCLELGCRRGAITSYWNPLVDKADAFDLMVKLGISVTPYPIYNSDERHSVIAKQRRKTDCLREPNPTEVIELYNGNAEAATMLAITRAAAAIGKQMKERGE